VGASSAERARRRSKAGVVGEQGGQSSDVARGGGAQAGSGAELGLEVGRREWSDGEVTEQTRVVESGCFFRAGKFSISIRYSFFRNHSAPFLLKQT
jgi:hypothetical protein